MKPKDRILFELSLINVDMGKSIISKIDFILESNSFKNI